MEGLGGLRPRTGWSRWARPAPARAAEVVSCFEPSWCPGQGGHHTGGAVGGRRAPAPRSRLWMRRGRRCGCRRRALSRAMSSSKTRLALRTHAYSRWTPYRAGRTGRDRWLRRSVIALVPAIWSGTTPASAGAGRHVHLRGSRIHKRRYGTKPGSPPGSSRRTQTRRTSQTGSPDDSARPPATPAIMRCRRERCSPCLRAIPQAAAGGVPPSSARSHKLDSFA
jgi:hypothetical protein